MPIRTLPSRAITDLSLSAADIAAGTITQDKLSANSFNKNIFDSSTLLSLQNDSIILNGTDGASANAGDNIVFDTAADVNDRVLLDGANAEVSGKVLQVVTATKTDTFTLSSSDGTFTDVTGLSVSITPTSTSSKIFIMANLNISGSNRYAAFKVLRDSTSIGIGDAASSRTRVAVSSHRNESASNDHHIMHNSSTNFLDSPNTTSATTYKIQIANTYVAGGYTVYVNRGNTDADANYAHRGASTITVMEVSA